MTRRPFTWQEVVIAALLLLSVISILAVLAFRSIPQANEWLFSGLSLGVVGASFLMWMNYRYGSAKTNESREAQFQMLMQHLMTVSTPEHLRPMIITGDQVVTKPAGTQLSDLHKSSTSPSTGGGQ